MRFASLCNQELVDKTIWVTLIWCFCMHVCRVHLMPGHASTLHFYSLGCHITQESTTSNYLLDSKLIQCCSWGTTAICSLAFLTKQIELLQISAECLKWSPVQRGTTNSPGEFNQLSLKAGSQHFTFWADSSVNRTSTQASFFSLAINLSWDVKCALW